ncbi:quinone oxidoreductase-like protein 1 [Elysia marginata]|uniref:Quinone oxidoreductase-like protein 1 n=1 Tax=Elysia marginata TaxID=1093978 RepID=A0AAV4J521_9GAST|nr:quinone oxidoreductase-like protein 1 [Elysia marginata]
MRELRGSFTGQEPTIEIKESEIPEKIQPNEILVKIKACAVDLSTEKTYNRLLASSLENCSIGHTVSGIVVKKGSNVEKYEEHISVVGVLPFGSGISGCCDMCVLNQFDTVKKPKDISHEVAAVSLCAGIAAYTAVHYLGHVTAGDTVLVMDGASPQGYLTIQLAQSFGAKVLSTYRTLTEKQHLENLKTPLAQLIEMTQRSTILASAVMEETGGVGVDCIIDNGVRLFTSEEDKDLMEERSMKSVPHKHDLLSCLGFAGRWITTNPQLQLDPPDSQQLFLRGGSLSFLFPPAWTLMRAQHGRFQHILKDVLDRMETGDFKLNDILSLQLEKAAEYLMQENLDSSKALVVIP